MVQMICYLMSFLYLVYAVPHRHHGEWLRFVWNPKIWSFHKTWLSNFSSELANDDCLKTDLNLNFGNAIMRNWDTLRFGFKFRTTSILNETRKNMPHRKMLSFNTTRGIMKCPKKHVKDVFFTRLYFPIFWNAPKSKNFIFGSLSVEKLITC